jgi:putative ABC transport system permease protein
VATRVALGASRGRLLGDLAVETGLLTLLGAGAGLLVAAWSLDLIVALRSYYVPRMEEVTLDLFAVATCLTLAGSVGLAAAFAPALEIPRARASRTMRAGSRGAGGRRGVRRLGGFLVAIETALALVLLAGAALLNQSYRALTDLDPGFDTDGLLHARVTPSAARYPDASARAALYRRLEDELLALPGVRAVALGNVPPGVGAGGEQPLEVAGTSSSAGRPAHGAWRSVGEAWFATLGVALRRGQALDASGDGARVAVVNEAFVRHHFPGGGELGAEVRMVPSGAGATAPESPWTIVGVVADVHEEYVYSPVPPTVYVPLAANPPGSVAIVAQVDGDPLALARPLRLAVARVDPELPVFGVRDLAYLLESEYDLNRLGLALLALFSGAALLLAVAGVHGVVSHSVERRMGELGIRVALGALRADIVRIVLGDSLRASVVGVAVGVGGLLLVGDRFGALTPRWTGLSPLVLAASAGAVIAVALTATLLPTRRALAADPVEALRRE